MTDRRRGARILVALSAVGGERPSLDLYRYLLGDTPPELVGLFVEDLALLAHARSGLAREIMLSGLERRLELGGLERQLRARSAALRRLFETESARLGVRHGFEVARGDWDAVLGRAAEQADALVVEPPGARGALHVWSRVELDPLAPLRTLLLTRGGWRPGGEVAVLIGLDANLAGSPGSALAAALRLARRTRSPLTALLTGAAAGSHGHAAETLEHLARLRKVELAGCFAVGGEPAPEIVAARARHARLVVLPGGLDSRFIGELFDRLRGALLLVRSTGTEN